IARWYVEAGKYDVRPLDSRGTARLAEERPQLAMPRARYVYYPGTATVANRIAPRILNRAHTITATITLKDGAEGVILAQGGNSGGYSLYVKDRVLHYAYNFLGIRENHVHTSTRLDPGRHEVRFEFEPTSEPDVAHGKGVSARAQL